MTTPSHSDRVPTDHDRADRNHAEDEAAAWFVLLSDEPDDGELRTRFETWYARSDLNKEIWERTCRAYRLVGEGPPAHREHWASYAAARQARRPLPGIEPQPSRPRGPPHRVIGFPSTGRLAAGAAALTVAAWLMIAVAPAVLLRMEADFITSTAELRTLVLEDGSRVRLAPESALDVAYSNGERRTRLLAGEAFFEVVPDAGRPFRVVAGEVATTVLGTAFEVRLDEGGAAVAVQRGYVRVDDDSVSPSVSEHLQAGDWVRVKARAGVKRGTTTPEDVGDWVGGQFVARNRPVAEIVDKLRRYYGGVIVVRDSAFAELQVSGIYDLRDPAATLRGLASAHGATVRQVSPWLLVVTAR